MSDSRGRDERADKVEGSSRPRGLEGSDSARSDAGSVSRRLAAAHAEIAELRTKIAIKDEELAGHDDEFGKMLARVAEVEARSKAAQKRASELEAQVRDAQANAEELARELEDSRLAVRESSRRMERREAEAADSQRLHGDLARVQGELARTLGDLARTQEELGAAQRRVSTERTAAEEAEHALALARREADGMRLQLADLEIFQVEVEELRELSTSLQGQFERAERELGEERAARARLAHELAAAAGVHDEVESLRAALVARGAEIERLFAQSAALGAERDAAQATLEEERGARTRLEQGLGSAREEQERASTRAALVKADLDVTIHDLEAERLRRKDSERLLEEERLARQADLSAARAQQSALSDELAAARLRAESVTAELVDVAAERESLKRQLVAAEGDHAAVAAALVAMTKERDAAMAEHGGTLEELTAVMLEKEEQARRLTGAEAELAQRAQGIARLEAELARSTAARVELEAQLAQHVERILTLQGELAAAGARAAQRDAELATARTELAALEARVSTLDRTVRELAAQRVADEEMLGSKISAVSQFLDEVERRESKQAQMRTESFLAIRSMLLPAASPDSREPPVTQSRPAGDGEETLVLQAPSAADSPSTQPEGGLEARRTSERPTAPERGSDPGEEPTRVRQQVVLTAEEAAELAHAMGSVGGPAVVDEEDIEDAEDVTHDAMVEDDQPVAAT